MGSGDVTLDLGSGTGGIPDLWGDSDLCRLVLSALGEGVIFTLWHEPDGLGARRWYFAVLGSTPSWRLISLILREDRLPLDIGFGESSILSMLHQVFRLPIPLSLLTEAPAPGALGTMPFPEDDDDDDALDSPNDGGNDCTLRSLALLVLRTGSGGLDVSSGPLLWPPAAVTVDAVVGPPAVFESRLSSWSCSDGVAEDDDRLRSDTVSEDSDGRGVL